MFGGLGFRVQGLGFFKEQNPQSLGVVSFSLNEWRTAKRLSLTTQVSCTHAPNPSPTPPRDHWSVLRFWEGLCLCGVGVWVKVRLCVCGWVVRVCDEGCVMKAVW